MRRRTAILALIAAAALAAILIAVLSGGSSESEAALGQQRAHLAFVAKQLHEIEADVRREVSASKQAWPLIDHGLQSQLSEGALAKISAASAAAAAMPSPTFLTYIHELTGPGARIARLFRSFSLLSKRGWSHVAEYAKAINEGAASAAFDRSNSGLYIDSIYNGSFDLSLIGEKVLASYEHLGEAEEFGSALTSAEVESIVKAYSPEADELQPHDWQELAAKG